MHQDAFLRECRPLRHDSDMATRQTPSDHAKLGKDWLAQHGFSPEIQQAIGAFVCFWSMLETRIEHVIWSFDGKPQRGERPDTDAEPLAAWLRRLDKIRDEAQDEVALVLTDFIAATSDLAAYRHAIAHGWLIPKGVGGPTFLTNTRYGEIDRKRPSQDAHVSLDMIDLAISAAMNLTQVASALIARDGAATLRAGAAAEAKKARSAANEVRHITALMNHEKY